MDLQELIKYVSEQVKNGKIKEDIIKDLLAAGWQQADIDNAFQKLAEGTVNEPVKATGLAIVPKKFILIGVGVLAIIIIAGITISIAGLNKSAKKPLLTVTPDKIKPAVTQNISPTASNLAQKVLDCGIQNYTMDLNTTLATPSGTPKPIDKHPNLECFISAAKTCQMAKLNVNISSYIAGATFNKTVSYYITQQVKNCVLHFYQGKSTAIFPTGLPIDQKNSMEDSLKIFDNKEGVCSYSSNQDLASVFEISEDVDPGNFLKYVKTASVGGQAKQNMIFHNGDCKGTYFNTLAQPAFGAPDITRTLILPTIKK